MRRLMFFGLGHLSNGDVSIAADFARQLPPAEFDVLFVTTPGGASHVRGLGLDARPLTGTTPDANLAIADTLVADFEPDLLIAADAFTLNYSTAWSGLSVRLLRERYGGPVASFDQYDYPAAQYIVDFYGGHRTHFPHLLDDCDLIIRNSPLNRPVPGTGRVIVSRMRCESPVRQRRGGVPTIFLVNSKWESVNVLRSRAMDQLIAAMPGLLHSHIAGLARPVRVIHVGPTPWRFPIADTVDYRYADRLSPGEFAGSLVDADLFLTTNAVSVTLTQAVLAGVPSLLLQNHKTVNLAAMRQAGALPAWLADAAPNLTVAYPFRVFPWGWHEFLTPVLTDNPYLDCFATAGIFERRAVLLEMTALLDGAAFVEHQQALHTRLAELPTAAEQLHDLNAYQI